MNTAELTEVQSWLMREWERARRIEEVMYEVREHYQNLFGEVYKLVRQRHAYLKEWKPRRLLERTNESSYVDGGGSVGFFNPEWCQAWSGWPSGIWLSNISLDELVSATEFPPNVCIWLSVSKETDRRIEVLRRRLSKLYKQRRGSSISFQESDETDPRVCLWYYLPEGREKLLRMVQQGGGLPFVNSMATHVGRMAQLLDGLESMLR